MGDLVISKYTALKAGAALAVALFVALGSTTRAEADQVVKICAVLPTSGPNAAVGVGMMNSMDLAVNRINESGRLGDITLELVRLDDQSQPSIGVNAVQRAASDPDVIACSAHWNSPVALATQNVFHRNGLANLVPAAINWRITEEQPGDEIFRISPPDTWQLEMAGSFPVRAFGHETFAVIDDNTEYGKSLVEGLTKHATEFGAERIHSDSITVGERDFTPILTRIRELEPEFLFFGGVTMESAMIRRQMARLGMESLYYTGSGTMSPTFLEIAGAAADGTYAYFYGPPYTTFPGGDEFIEAYNAAGYDNPYETYGIWAYASIEVLAEAIKRANENGSITRRAVVEELKAGSFETMIGDVSFGPTGDIEQRQMVYYEVRDGQWIATHYNDADGNIVEAEVLEAWELPWTR